MFNFSNLTPLQNVLLSWGFVVALLVGVFWGFSGKQFKWERKAKPYLFWAGIAMIVGVSIWNIIG